MIGKGYVCKCIIIIAFVVLCLQTSLEGLLRLIEEHLKCIDNNVPLFKECDSLSALLKYNLSQLLHHFIMSREGSNSPQE